MARVKRPAFLITLRSAGPDDRVADACERSLAGRGRLDVRHSRPTHPQDAVPEPEGTGLAARRRVPEISPKTRAFGRSLPRRLRPAPPAGYPGGMPSGRSCGLSSETGRSYLRHLTGEIKPRVFVRNLVAGKRARAFADGLGPGTIIFDSGLVACLLGVEARAGTEPTTPKILGRCAVLDLSATIVHELNHVVWLLGERRAWLMTGFYRRQVSIREGNPLCRKPNWTPGATGAGMSLATIQGQTRSFCQATGNCCV